MQFLQPRSQALSPLVVEIMTPVAAAQVTTQYPGVKKYVGREGWQNYLTFCGFQTSSSRYKLPALLGFEVEFLPMKKHTLFDVL